MLVTVWIIAVDGGDRIYTSTKPPTYQCGPNDKIFRVQTFLPGYRQTDGGVRAIATPVEDLGIRLPSPQELVESGK